MEPNDPVGHRLVEHSLDSPALGNSRRVWVQRPETAAASRVCVFLDAEYFIDAIGAPEIIERLQAEKRIPPLFVAYVSHVDHSTRWPESFCNPKFDQFIVGELLPWITQNHSPRGSRDCAIAGLSLTGLSAAHVALRHPDAISAALCQSASFWWNDSWLIDHLVEVSRSKARFRISVGSSETSESVDHGGGLIQAESQLDSNRRMRDALVAEGHRVSYGEFRGGHEIDAWREDLPGSLVSLFEL